MYVYFSAALADAADSCFLYYNVGANQIELLQDSGTTWLAATPGAATMLQNSQCSLNVAGTSTARNGNTLTLNVAMTFLPAYAGARNIYMYATDISGATSGWQQEGAWNVPAGAGVRRRSPFHPILARQPARLSHSSIQTRPELRTLQSVWMYFSAALTSANNSCFLYYSVGTNQIELLQDNGTAWLIATPGAATTLQNGQCSLNVAVLRHRGTATR